MRLGNYSRFPGGQNGFGSLLQNTRRLGKVEIDPANMRALFGIAGAEHRQSLFVAFYLSFVRVFDPL